MNTLNDVDVELDNQAKREELKAKLDKAALEFAKAHLDGANSFAVARTRDALHAAAEDLAISGLTIERWDVEALRRCADRMIEDADTFNKLMGPRPGEKTAKLAAPKLGEKTDL